MPPKTYNNSRRKTARNYRVSVKKANSSAKVIQSMTRRTLYKTLETKHSLSSNSDGQEIGHNSFVSRSTNLLSTSLSISMSMIDVTQLICCSKCVSRVSPVSM